MMAAGVREPIGVDSPQISFHIGFPTNISIAVPAHIIGELLQSLRKLHPIDPSQFPTGKEWKRAQGGPASEIRWTPQEST
jgi:hypothetical protein